MIDGKLCRDPSYFDSVICDDNIEKLALCFKKILKLYNQGVFTDVEMIHKGLRKVCDLLYTDITDQSFEVKTDLVLSLGFWGRWTDRNEDILKIKACLENLCESRDRQIRAVTCSAFGFVFIRDTPSKEYFVWDFFHNSLKGNSFEKTSVLFGLQNAVTNPEIILPKKLIEEVVELIFTGDQDIREDASSIMAAYSISKPDYLISSGSRLEKSISTEISSRVTDNLRKILDNIA